MHTTLATAAFILALAGPDSAEVQRAVQTALGRADYQRRLPYGDAVERETPPPPPPRRRRAAPAPEPAGAPARMPVISLPPVVFWVLAAGIGLGLVFWALGEFRRATRATPASPAAVDAGSAPPREPRRRARPPVLDDAERLAAEGRFAEAIHALLLMALARLSPAPALTAREVLRGASVVTEARDALHTLVNESERVHFAGGAAGITDFQRCREHWQRFSAACRPARA